MANLHNHAESNRVIGRILLRARPHQVSELLFRAQLIVALVIHNLRKQIDTHCVGDRCAADLPQRDNGRVRVARIVARDRVDVAEVTWRPNMDTATQNQSRL